MATRTEAVSPQPEHAPPQAYPSEKARQGETILKTKGARLIFLAGLFGGLIVLIALAIYLGIVS
jgi:hypothetical protein